MKKVAVIGGGASGMIAAYAAGTVGCDVTLFEKNEKLGKKIYITGKGRCNVTNAANAADFFQNIVTNPKFMYKSFHGFDNRALMELIEGFGTRLKIERGNRVFPVSDHASDITKALVKAMESEDVKIRLNKTIDSVEKLSEGFSLNISGGRKEEFDAVILACGGASYPGAGGSTRGYEIAKKLGISVVDIRPSLVPFLLKEDFISDLAGLSLRNVRLNIYEDEKRIFSDFGEMLFTHKGISGPLVLTASALIGDRIKVKGSLNITIDLKPAIEFKELDTRLVNIIKERGKRQLPAIFEGLLPKSLIPVFVKLMGFDKDNRQLNSITKEERKRLLHLVKEFPLTLTGLCGFNEAVVTKGGIDVKEINPSTMEVKKLNGLYICGEMLDVDAFTGGFNLQCAFSTGYAAGISAGG